MNQPEDVVPTPAEGRGPAGLRASRGTGRAEYIGPRGRHSAECEVSRRFGRWEKPSNRRRRPSAGEQAGPARGLPGRQPAARPGRPWRAGSSRSATAPPAKGISTMRICSRLTNTTADRRRSVAPGEAVPCSNGIHRGPPTANVGVRSGAGHGRPHTDPHVSPRLWERGAAGSQPATPTTLEACPTISLPD